MKNITLINNEWKELVDSNITSEEDAFILNENTPLEERLSLSNNIKMRQYQEILEEERSIVENIYNKYYIPNSTLISVNIYLPEERGIINCRIDGEHKQIRF